jgi:hypothetical protein
MKEWQCNLVKDFINDNTEISLLYMIRSKDDTCGEMKEFIEEMQLESRFYIYCNIKANSN